MEFINRKAPYPGRIKLINVDTGEETICDLLPADNPTESGTVINAEMFNLFEEDILNELTDYGTKGDTGDTGQRGPSGNYITAISLKLV